MSKKMPPNPRIQKMDKPGTKAAISNGSALKPVKPAKKSRRKPVKTGY